MKKIILILLCASILCICGCGGSKYDKHVKNIEEFIITITSNDDELIKELKDDRITLREDICQKVSANYMRQISEEYETIESEEDKSKFLAYIKSRISQNMYDRFSNQIEENKLHEDIWDMYN